MNEYDFLFYFACNNLFGHGHDKMSKNLKRDQHSDKIMYNFAQLLYLTLHTLFMENASRLFKINRATQEERGDMCKSV